MRLVGELRLDLDERRLDAIASTRARSLLAWLAYHPGLHPRTRVASVFWPKVLESSARASLRTTLTTLRRQAGDEVSAVVHAGRDRVGIEDGPAVWIDVKEAERLLAEGRLEAALELCDGNLLTDLDDDWVLEERTVHRERVAAILDALGEAAEGSGDVHAAARYARRRLDLEPASEQAARVLMQRLARSGDGAAAVATYESLRAALRRDYGMAPSAETRALVETLRSAPRARAEKGGALPLPPALARSDHAPLVGREEQLAALRSAWKRASSGAASVVMVSGEAGSGKTRLLTELAGEVRTSGAEVLAGRCMEDGMVAFAPFTEALRHHVGRDADALPAWMVAELARLLPELGSETGRGDSDPRDVRHRLFEAVAGVIGQTAKQGPILLVVEDLHWADPPTLQMLAHVVRTVVWAPLLVVGSLRDAAGEATVGLPALFDDLRRERRLERVRLTGLSESEAGDLAAAWLGAGPPPALIASVHRRTGGNPLFIEELVRHLVESHEAEPADVLTARVGSDVPGGVQAVIEHRLSRLAEPAGRAVRVAAIAGEDFALTDVAAACEEQE